MTESQIKEALSNNYVGILANRWGYQLEKPQNDTGVDYTIRYDTKRKIYGKISFIKSPYSCDVQLKSTTAKYISTVGKHLVYYLKVKNYNDLVHRRKLGHTPLILILFILPNSRKEWVRVLKDELILSKNAFYYYPPKKNIKLIKNKTKIRLEIPLSNKLDLHFFNKQISKWIPKWK